MPSSQPPTPFFNNDSQTQNSKQSEHDKKEEILSGDAPNNSNQISSNSAKPAEKAASNTKIVLNFMMLPKQDKPEGSDKSELGSSESENNFVESEEDENKSVTPDADFKDALIKQPS